jgi:hypothetical protein
MAKQLESKQTELFGDIYEYDKEVENRIQELVDSDECVKLLKKAQSTKSTLFLLDDVVSPRKTRFLPRLLSKVRPFYRREEYQTKEEYLQYLKYAYGFLLTPMEVPPSRTVGLFFPNHKKTWSPSEDSAQELLKKFYVEVALISELTSEQWNEVAGAHDPEAAINKMIFKTRFTSDFMEFLKKIPWIISDDVYGAPGLDIVYRRAPGHLISKKPFGVGEDFIKKLVKSSSNNQIHTVMEEGEEKIRLKHKKQIIKKIESEGTAHLDSFMGISKIERDFVIHQHIAIWNNPGFKKYENATIFQRILYAKPPRFLCAIREEALPLEIPFVSRNSNKYGK